jgi:hypothetical protein
MAIPIIHNSKYNAHTESLFKKSSILPLPSLAEFFKIQLIHQHYFKQLPASFGSTWSTNAERRDEVHHIALRNEEDYCEPLSRLSSTDNHPLVYFPKIWNEFQSLIKSTANKIILKLSYKNTFWINFLKIINVIDCSAPIATYNLQPICRLERFHLCSWAVSWFWWSLVPLAPLDCPPYPPAPSVRLPLVTVIVTHQSMLLSMYLVAHNVLGRRVYAIPLVYCTDS